MKKYPYRYLLIYVILIINIFFIPFLSLSQTEAFKNKVIKKIPTEANQGVAVDNEFYYAISNTKISKHYKTSGELVASWQANVEDSRFKHFKHMNSGTVINGKLYVAHSRYNIDPNDNTLEVFLINGKMMEHEKTIRMPRKHGSLTWADKHPDGSWWICYAVYGEGINQNTKLVKYQYKNEEFVEEKSWFFPKEVVENWGDMSCSGGSWGPDGKLYTTGHDHKKAFVLELDHSDKLKYIRTENNMGFFGQAIAWDRFTDKSILWGIEKRKFVSANLISLE